MTITREQVLESLHTDWGTFVTCFQQLPPEAQAAYLQRQGYARFADLLAHIIAWWEEGVRAIHAMLANPAYASPDYDVDRFNAQAVHRFKDMDEAAVIVIYENLRRRWTELVNVLPAEAFQNHLITHRMDMEIIGHIEGHRPCG